MAELLSVDPRNLQFNPNNPRRAPAPPAMDEQLLASITAVGIIHPPYVTPKDDGLMIVVGNRRVKAAIAAGASVADFKAVPSATAKMIDVAQVQGQVHAQSVQKVGELADKNPTEAISIIRSWLHESA